MRKFLFSVSVVLFTAFTASVGYDFLQPIPASAKKIAFDETYNYFGQIIFAKNDIQQVDIK